MLVDGSPTVQGDVFNRIQGQYPCLGDAGVLAPRVLPDVHAKNESLTFVYISAMLSQTTQKMLDRGHLDAAGPFPPSRG